MNRITIIFLLVTLINACAEKLPIPKSNSKKSLGQQTIIFGHFYGFCAGESCIEIYQLSQKDLAEDTNDNYPNPASTLETNFVALDQSKFDLVNNIAIEIPKELLKVSDNVIGAPDAADGGGIYIEIPDGRFWLLDMNPNYLPDYLLPLRKKVITAIDLINQ